MGGGKGGGAGGAHHQNQKTTSSSSNQDDSNTPFSFATTPNGVCMALGDAPGQHGGAAVFDASSDPESRPRGYHFKHTIPFTSSPFEGALSQVESWFARSLLSGGATSTSETAALLPTTLLYTSATSGKFPYVVRSSLWSSMDLSHLRSAFLLDQGMTQSSKVVDEAALIKSATASSIESSQPYALPLLMLARGVNFVMSSSFNLPLTPHSSRQMAKMVTGIMSGEIGVDKIMTSSKQSQFGGADAAAGSTRKSGGGDGNTTTQQQSGGGGKGNTGGNSKDNNVLLDPVALSQQIYESTSALARGTSEIVHYALHCQPSIIQQQQRRNRIIREKEGQQQQVTVTVNPPSSSTGQKRTSSKEGARGDNNTNTTTATTSMTTTTTTTEKALVEMSASEASCIALWGASI